MSARPFGAALLIIAVASSDHAIAQFPGSSGTLTAPPPGSTRVLLTADKPEFMLGENVLVHYCLENISAQPVSIEVGGDYRGGTRSNRFKVTVTDERGRAMPDPDPRGYNLGGIGTSPTLKTGERWCQSLPLMRYARIDEAGRYNVRITHDLGWPRGRAPEGEINVTLTMPSAADAGRVVRSMSAIRPPSVVMGQLSGAWDDFSTLRYPVYLDPLRTLAQGGDVNAVIGVGAIPTPEATRTLIELLAAAPALARSAAQQLAMRLPDPALTGDLPNRGPFTNDVESPRVYLRNASWRPEFAPDVRAAARSLLMSAETQDLVEGGFFLEAVGTPEDAPALSRAFSKAIELTRTLPFEAGGYPRPRGACAELMRAAEMVVARGYTADAAGLQTPGEIILWLVNFGRGARPVGWETILARALTHPIPYVREVALDKLPESVPGQFADAIGESLGSADVDEQIAACKVVARATLGTFQSNITSIVSRATDFGLVNESEQALFVLAGRVSVLKTQAVRLGQPGQPATAATDTLRSLLGVFEGDGSQSDDKTVVAEAAQLSARWIAFIEAHRDELSAGQKISLDRSDIPTNLVPAGWSVYRRGKPSWPPRR